jgi:hypothetical protein
MNILLFCAPHVFFAHFNTCIKVENRYSSVHHLAKMITFYYYYRISRPIRRTVIFSLGILEKNNNVRILILVIYWKHTGLLHTKIINHNIIYSS